MLKTKSIRGLGNLTLHYYTKLCINNVWDWSAKKPAPIMEDNKSAAKFLNVPRILMKEQSKFAFFHLIVTWIYDYYDLFVYIFTHWWLWFSTAVLMMLMLLMPNAKMIAQQQGSESSNNKRIKAICTFRFFNTYLTNAFLWHLESLPRFIATHSELWDFEQ